jgi:hypothetical protein
MRWQIAQLAFSRNGDAAVSADFWGVNELHGEDRPKRKCRGLATSLRHFRPVLPPNSQLAARTTHRLFVHRPVETAYVPFDRPTLPARYQKIFKLCQLRSDSTAQAFALLSSRDSRPAASLPPGLPSLAPPPPLHTPGPRQKPPTSAAGAVQCRPAVAASPTRGTRAKQRQG